MSQTYVPAPLRRLVKQRAGDCCEYCLVPQSAVFVGHEVDHIVAEKHRGETAEENLALCCAVCNKHKGSDLASIDPELGKIVPLFHPRRDRWNEHFHLSIGRIEPLTSTGRVTVHLLQLNHPDRVCERTLMHDAGQIHVPAKSE